MKIKNLFIICLTINALQTTAQTHFANKMEVSGTWTKEYSPYVIQGEAIVPASKTLRIEAGVVVQLQNGKHNDFSRTNFDVGCLRVKGQIVVNGDINKPVIFTGIGEYENWGGIVIDESTKTNEMNFCIVELSKGLSDFTNDTVHASAWGAITVHKSVLKITNSLFRNNDYGFYCISAKDLQIENCVIYNSKNLGVYNGYGSITKILNTTMFNSQFSAFQSITEIKNCIFWSTNESKAFYSDFEEFNGNCTYSCIKGIDIKKKKIFDKEPMFIDAANANFELTQTSPCRGSGENQQDMGANINKLPRIKLK